MKQEADNNSAAGAPLGKASHHIFLIGLMGAGKTYWAQRLSQLLSYDWIDLDQQIEKGTGITVREIFATEGEEAFRAKERDTLRQLSSVKKLVVACGGGTPCFHDNMRWMNENGITVWLCPDIDETVVRLKRGKHKRPLIAHLNDDELKDFVVQKTKEREPFYSQASHHICGDDISLDTFTKLFNHA